MLEHLSQEERNQFADIVNNLLFRKYLTEKVYSKVKDDMVFNPDYRFVEIYKDEVFEYLKYIGWQLNEDKNNGVFFISHEENSYNIRLNLFTTKIVLLLRMLFEKKQEEVSLTNTIYFSLSEVLEQGSIVGVIRNNPNKKEIEHCMILLRKYKIIDKIKGKYSEVDTVYVLYPTIIQLVSSEVVLGALNAFKDEIDAENIEDIEDDVNFENEGELSENDIFENNENAFVIDKSKYTRMTDRGAANEDN